MVDWSDDELRDEEYPDEFDDDSDDDIELRLCPECGASIYEEAQQCPHCGAYVTFRHTAFAGRPWWWIVLGLLGIAAVIWMLTMAG